MSDPMGDAYQLGKDENWIEHEPDYNIEEPEPMVNDLPHVWDLVVVDMKKRDKKGLRQYKTHLQPFNGRDALIDLYQELLDSVVYARQMIYERDGK